MLFGAGKLQLTTAAAPVRCEKWSRQGAEYVNHGLFQPLLHLHPRPRHLHLHLQPHQYRQIHPNSPEWTKFEPASSIFEFLLFFYCFWTCNMFVSAVSPFFNRFCPFFDTKSFSVGCLSLWVNWVISEIQKNLYATHKYLYTPGFVLNKYTNT